MITKEEVAAMPKSDRVRMSHQPRKHYRGKMVMANGGPRAHTHGGHSQARAGWTCDDTKNERWGRIGEPSRSTGLSPYRVTMPNGRVKYVRPHSLLI